MEIRVRKVSNGYIVDIFTDYDKYNDAEEVTKIATSFNDVVKIMVECFEADNG